MLEPNPALRLRIRMGSMAALVVAIACAAVAPGVVRASGGILDGVRSLTRDGALVIAIDLAEDAQYVSHTLAASGDVLQIRLRRTGTTQSDTAQVPGRAGVAVGHPLAALISELSSSGDRGVDVTVIVRFTRVVQPNVFQGGDRRTVFIALPGAVLPTSASSEPAAVPPLRDGSGREVSASPTPPPQPFEISGDPMEDARRAMTAKDYPAAIRFLTKVLQSPDPTPKQEAQELLGVARERNNQLAHAKAEYEEYLRLYPTGEGADRVRQRLAALVSFSRSSDRAAAPGQPALGRPPIALDYSGSFSQYFRRDSSISDDEGGTVNQSFLTTDADLSSRLRTENFDLRAHFNGGYRYDIEGSGTGANTRVRYLYLDGSHRGYELNTRVGRQSRSTGGVQGRFDGALLSYRTTARSRVNLVGGCPVDLTEANAIDTDRYFYGLSVDLGTFLNHWDGTLYALEQRASDVVDRRAVGGELRYVRPEASVFTLVDYDIFYNELNTWLLFGNYRFQNAATVGLSLDVRASPGLRTSNAIIGQPVDDFDDLLDTYDDDEVQDLAVDRTAKSRSLTLSGSYPFTERLQMSGDFTISDVSHTPTSGGVEGTPSTGLEYYSTLQLIGTEMVQLGDVHIVGLRYAATGSIDTIGLMANSRFPGFANWRFNPRLRLDFQRLADDSGAAVIRPSLLVDYRWRRLLTLELEGGYEGVADLYGDGNNGRNGYYIYIGYRLDF